jgi:hypothetical protein
MIFLEKIQFGDRIPDGHLLFARDGSKCGGMRNLIFPNS